MTETETMTMTELAKEDDVEVTWSSGPLPLLSAVRVWCAGAGTAGAWFPDLLERLAVDTHCGCATLSELWTEAMYRLNWRATYQPRGLPAPRHPSWDGECLEWHTSVTVRLAPAAEGMWEVTLFGEHVTRQAVMVAAMAVLAAAD